MRPAWVLMLAVLLALACAACGAGAAAESGRDVDDVSGAQLSEIPTEDTLPPFEVEVGGVFIVDESPAEPLSADVDADVDADVSAEVACRKLALRGPTFASNEIVLNEEGRQTLDLLLDELSEHTCSVEDGRCRRDDVRVVLTGHTDDQPTTVPGGNLQLSKDRARAVAAVFVEHGIMNVKAEGLAATKPAPAPVPDLRTAEEIRADDRRVTIEIFCG